MTAKKSFWLGATILLLSGCTAAHVVGIALDINSTMKPALQCYDDLKSDPAYVKIHQKFAVDTGDDPTEAQLKDYYEVSPDMMQLGMEWYAKHLACNVMAVQYASNYDQRYGAMVAGFLAEGADIYADALKTHPTYSHINYRLKAFKEHQRQEMAEYLKTEAQRRTSDTERVVGDVLSTSLNITLLALQARQGYLENAQMSYYARVPNYRPVVLTSPVCVVAAGKVFCSQATIQ